MSKKIFMPAPDRAHYDRILTWAKQVIARQEPEVFADFTQDLRNRAAVASRGADDAAKVRCVLAELGLCYVIDSLLEDVEMRDGGQRA